MPRCNAARRVKFYFLDGLVAAPILLSMLYPSKLTLSALGLVTIALVILDKKGMRLPALLRYARSAIVGPVRYIRPWWRK